MKAEAAVQCWSFRRAGFVQFDIQLAPSVPCSAVAPHGLLLLLHLCNGISFFDVEPLRQIVQVLKACYMVKYLGTDAVEWFLVLSLQNVDDVAQHLVVRDYFFAVLDPKALVVEVVDDILEMRAVILGHSKLLVYFHSLRLLAEALLSSSSQQCVSEDTDRSVDVVLFLVPRSLDSLE